MDTSFLETIKTYLKEILVSIGPELIYSAVALVLGIIFINLIMKVLKAALRKSKVELSLKTFVESLSIFVLYGLLFTLIGSILGIKATSFLAIFGAAGIAIGLALQGSLANFAGGVLILVFKPFKVGDLIHVNSSTGYVVNIDILYTRIETFDGRIITMPNGNVANSDVDNRTMNPLRRVDLSFKFAFDIKMETIRPIILEAMKAHPIVEKEPEPDVWLEEIGESEIRVTARCWVESIHYWPTFWEQLEAVKKALDAHGIETPIPRRIVYQGGEYKASESLPERKD
ncbi:mechanosensitive ion channel family protein [Psychroflexus sediminis]|uniref:Small conductance mechanosensitive channel n=1 Tax=Psychroflexus sediminis TaxID=470826 RepID=A0A1G7VTS4_9FLAO|nr:mechanosensitive ion channel family protein [Psychroflexus sediminis]SDG63202.1 small conductance mechanosensitive channel [Psychroflexus sediminis]